MIIIGHDGEGYGTRWYLDMEIVKEFKDTIVECVIPTWNWVDTQEFLCMFLNRRVDVGKVITKLVRT